MRLGAQGAQCVPDMCLLVLSIPTRSTLTSECASVRGMHIHPIRRILMKSKSCILLNFFMQSRYKPHKQATLTTPLAQCRRDLDTSALVTPTSMPRPCSPGEVQLKRRRGLRLGVPQRGDLMLRRPPSPTLQPRRKSARTCSPHALAAPELNPTPSAPLVGASASPSSKRGNRPPLGESRPMPS